MKFKLTKLEKQWILYDVGNSAFILLVATMVPIYFNYLAEQAGISDVDYLAYWAYAASASTLLVAVLGPIFGTLADTRGFKKRLFAAAMLIGAIGCTFLGFVHSWVWFLGIFVVAKVGYSVSLIFYDSMLSDVTTEERMDEVSSQGYAWGYIGSCIPFVAGLALVLGQEKLGIGLSAAMAIAFVITSLWWVGVTIPLLRNYEQRHWVNPEKGAVRESFRRLYETFQDIKGQKHIFVYLLAFFFYIDGVYTIIDMATAYGEALGLDTTGLLLALLVTQIVAFPFALLFGRLSARFEAHKIINLCIVAYLCIALFAIQLDTQGEFWFLAVCVGMFQGTIQALSRSYFAKIIPDEKSGEYFGILDICGKGASFLGTFLVGAISQVTNNVSYGVGALAVLFLIGLVLFQKAVALNPSKIHRTQEKKR